MSIGNEGDAVAGMVARAEALIELRRFDEALELLAEAAVRQPDHPRLHCLASLAELRAGRSAEALKRAEKAAALEPAWEWPHRLRSSALVAEARRVKLHDGRRLGVRAVAAAEEALRLDPFNPRGYCAATEAYLAAGDVPAADSAAQRAVELAPAMADAWVASSQVALRARNWAAAESACRTALQFEADSYPAMNNLGAALRGAGRWKEAAEAFAEAARRNPRGDVARRNLTTTGLTVVRLGVLVLLLPCLLIPGGVLIYLGVAAGASLLLRNPARRARVDAWGSRIGLRMARSRFSARPVITGVMVVIGVAMVAVLVLGGAFDDGRAGDPSAVVTSALVAGVIAIWMTVRFASRRRGGRADRRR